MLKKFLHVVLDWFLPKACCVCNSLADVEMIYESKTELLDICNKCLSKISFTKNRCFQCGKRLDESGRDNLRCEGCQDFNMVIYQTVAGCDYKYPARKLVNGLKFGDRKCIAKILAFILIQKISTQEFDMPQAIVPVPLHKRILRFRGYNQSLEIANYVGAELGIPVVTDICIRKKYIKEKFGLSLMQKKLNARHAFMVNAKANQYEHIAIIEDLVVSGSTVCSLALELSKSKIERIDLWCVCRV